MLPPPKRWKRKYDASIKAEDDADDDLDESEDDKPDWHASFNVESRTAGVLMIENVAWVREALHVSTKLRAREVKHVMWWDTQAINPKREALYALPHLNYTHNTGVVEFSVRGFGPHLFSEMGSACAFAGAALHESVPKRNLLRPVRKVALFFA